MTDADIVEFLTKNRQSHTSWAEFFEANPEVEKEYVATGQWDGAKEQRRLEQGYTAVIDRFKELTQ